jgi:hypothetical protein
MSDSEVTQMELNAYTFSSKLVVECHEVMKILNQLVQTFMKIPCHAGIKKLINWPIWAQRPISSDSNRFETELKKLFELRKKEQ